MIAYLVIAAICGLLLYKYSDSLASITSGMATSSHNDLHNTRDLFFKTVFPLLGYVAKRDGPINEKEVKRTEVFMENLNLDAQDKKEAIRLFKSGADPQFNIKTTITAFSGVTKKHPNLVQILLVYLINIARVDGFLVKQEVDAVQKVAMELGYSSITFTHLLQMISSQNEFADAIKNTSQDTSSQSKQQSKPGKTGASKESTGDAFTPGNLQAGKDSCEEKTKKFNSGSANIAMAYEVLGLSPKASSAEVKKAYRILASQYHPDKLTGEGLPAFMIQSTTECFKTIQTAYEYINKARKSQVR